MLPELIRKIWEMLIPSQRRSALVLLGLMLVGMSLETLGIGLVIPAIALLTQPDITQHYPFVQPFVTLLGSPDRQTLAIGGMIALVAVYLVKESFLALLAWRQMHFAFGLQAHLSQRLFQIYLSQPYTFHMQKNSAQLIRNVVNEVSMFTGSGMLPGMSFLTEIMVLVGLATLLLVVEPRGALLVVAVLGVATWIFYGFMRSRIARWGEIRQHSEGMRLQHLQQGLGGVKDVKLLAKEGVFLQRYREQTEQSARVERLQNTMNQIPRLWLELLAVSGLAILVTSMIVQGRSVESILPTLGLFAATAFRLIPSANRILGAMQVLRYSKPVIELLHKELQLKPEKVGNNDFQQQPMQVELELRQITYTYPTREQPALREISLKIARGEMVGFIGPSGSGKSSLVDVILGLLSPEHGGVYVDGQDIRGNLRSWQRQIGYVPQSIFLTDDSLRRNIAFGVPDEQIDAVALARAIKDAQLERFVADLPKGLDAMVGERGIRLSGGQRQRIGIARALYHDPNVLVLDEASSALDNETEQEVMQAVRALHGEKTIILIAHRLTTVAHCDRLFRLEQGCLVEEGAPDQMLTQAGFKEVVENATSTR